MVSTARLCDFFRANRQAALELRGVRRTSVEEVRDLKTSKRGHRRAMLLKPRTTEDTAV
jgi:hypothetical protein